MAKKFYSIFLLSLMITFFATGCQSQPGAKLTKALAKQMSIKSFNAETNVTFKNTVNGSSSDDIQAVLMNDIYSNISVKLNESIDIEKNQCKIDGNVKLNGITGEYELYQKDSNIWGKYPPFSKYIQMDLAKAGGLASSDEYVKLKAKINQLVSLFMSKYILDSKFQLNNIKDNGPKSVQTAQGTNNATEIQVTMDSKECFEFMKTGINQLFDSNDFRNLIIEIAKETDGANAVDDQFKKNLDKYLKYHKEEFNKNFTNPEYLNFSIVFKFYIDSNDNIIRETASFVSNMEEDNNYYGGNFEESTIQPKVTRTILFDITTDISNINQATSISYPEFNKDNTVSFDKYFEDNANGEKFSVKSYIESKLEQQKHQIETRIYLDSSYKDAYVRGNYTNIANKYVKGGTTYLPAKTMAEALAVDIDNDSSKVTFTGNGKTLVMFVNSKKTLLNGTPVPNNYIVDIKNGVTMVPVKFVAQAFGATVKAENGYLVIQPAE